MTVHLSERLAGRELDDWRVIERVEKVDGMTGSNFSIGYTAEHSDGRPGFVKVLDISRASLTEDPARTLEYLTTAFNFERDILAACKGMSRVVHVLADGTVKESTDDRLEVAQYIVFELASTDFRKLRLTLSSFDTALSLRTLHHVATGLAQLHGRKIAHQDLKPSNVLVFDGQGSKLGDLGRSSARSRPGPHDDLNIPGDLAYAPPELVYGHAIPDWDTRRRASDLYQLGSLVAFAFTGVGMTPVLNKHTHERHRSTTWSSSYMELLPYMEVYFRLAMEEMQRYLPYDFQNDLALAIRQLCHPDPRERGHPVSHRTGNRYGLERYVSLFNRLALEAELNLRGSLR